MESRGRTFLQELRDAIEGSDRLIAVIGPNAYNQTTSGQNGSMLSSSAGA